MERRKLKIKNTIEYLFKKATPQIMNKAIQILWFCLVNSLIIKYPESSQKNWLKETGCKRVLERKKAGENINANTAITIAIILPLSSFTARAIITTDKDPIIAGKNLNANTVFPNKRVDIFDKRAITGGTDT